MWSNFNSRNDQLRRLFHLSFITFLIPNSNTQSTNNFIFLSTTTSTTLITCMSYTKRKFMKAWCTICMPEIDYDPVVNDGMCTY